MILFLQAFYQYHHHIIFQHFATDTFYTAMPAFDTTYSMQHDQYSSRGINIFDLTFTNTFFNNGSDPLAIGTALTLHIRQIRISKVFPLAVHNIYFFIMIHHLVDMKAKDAF